MTPTPKPKKTVRKSKHITNPKPYDGAVCWACGCDNMLQTHEIYGGPFRNKSIAFDMQVILCDYHHDMIHSRDGKRLKGDLKTLGQNKFEQNHTREEFISTFGRSYL